MYQKSIINLVTSLKTSLLLIILLLTPGCSSINRLALETKANDPIMMNLMDNDIDLVQIENGTGSTGDATACPT